MAFQLLELRVRGIQAWTCTPGFPFRHTRSWVRLETSGLYLRQELFPFVLLQKYQVLTALNLGFVFFVEAAIGRTCHNKVTDLEWGQNRVFNFAVLSTPNEF